MRPRLMGLKGRLGAGGRRRPVLEGRDGQNYGDSVLQLQRNTGKADFVAWRELSPQSGQRKMKYNHTSQRLKVYHTN
jgi:hypothetical protein